MNNEERLELYSSRIRNAVKLREQKGFDALWKRLRDQYANRETLGTDPSNCKLDPDIVNVPFMFSTIDTIVASTSTRPPYTTVLPRDVESIGNARLAEHAVNRVWDEQEWVEELRRMVIDLILIGNGVLRSGYDFRLATPSRKMIDDGLPKPDYEDGDGNKPFDLVFEQVYKEARRLGSNRPPKGGVRVTENEARNMLSSYDAIVVTDTPTLARVDPMDFVFDFRLAAFEDSSWCAQRIIMPRHRAIARWKKKAEGLPAVSDEVRHDTISVLTGELDGFTINSHDELVEVWEFYDLEEGTVCFLSLASTSSDTGSPSWLMSPTDVKAGFGHPYIFRNCLISDEPLGIGVGEIIESTARLFNATMEQIDLEMRAASVKYLTRNSVVTEEMREDLRSGEPGTVVRLPEDYEGPLDQAVSVLQSTRVDPDKRYYQETVKSLLFMVSGVADYQRGGSSLASTATEAAIIAGTMSARSSKLMATVEGMIKDASSNAIDLMQRYMTIEREIVIRGRKGLRYSRNQLRGSYDFKVEVGSSQPTSEAGRRELAQALMTVVAPFMQAGVVDPGQFLEYVLSIGFSIVDPSKFIQEPDETARFVAGTPDEYPKPVDMPGVSGMPGVPVPNTGGQAIQGGYPGGGQALPTGI